MSIHICNKLLPDLHSGVSTNDFEEDFRALFGKSVKGLSAASVAHLKGGCELEYARWHKKIGFT